MESTRASTSSPSGPFLIIPSSQLDTPTIAFHFTQAITLLKEASEEIGVLTNTFDVLKSQQTQLATIQAVLQETLRDYLQRNPSMPRQRSISSPRLPNFSPDPKNGRTPFTPVFAPQINSLILPLQRIIDLAASCQNGNQHDREAFLEAISCLETVGSDNENIQNLLTALNSDLAISSSDIEDLAQRALDSL
jgi:hypothetical protein